MMTILRYPDTKTLAQVLQRPKHDSESLRSVVLPVIEQVKTEGDAAVKRYEQQFDHVSLSELRVSEDEITAAEEKLSPDLCKAIQQAYQNIYTFHSAQQFAPIKVETQPGVHCEQRMIPIERVGLYVPGGTAPLFSTVLMLATPAVIAGCKQIVLCSPPDNHGDIHPAILYAAKIAGIRKIFKIGGTQAIAAMAFGTETVPQVDKILGPGNQYVMAAKQIVSLGDVAIDMPAGPSEIVVRADETANPAFLAADLLSQAEHGVDSQAVLITTNEQTLTDTLQQVESQLSQLPRKEMAKESLKHSCAILVHNTIEAINISNFYAPEHLIINTSDYEQLAEKVMNAGSVFLGEHACESAGDYASGTNHTLPTSGYAKAYSGVSLDSFVRKVTFQHISKEGIRNIGPTIEIMAEAEQLQAHRNAVSIRLKSL